MSENDRVRAIVKARHLMARADHPGTPEEEKKTAQVLFNQLCEKYKITVGELGSVKQRTGANLYREIERSFGTELASKIYESLALDEILDSIGDARSRDLIDISLARMVEFFSGNRK